MLVTTLGVTMDGTDQTTQIRRAFNSVNAGETLEFPSGTVRIKGEVSIPANVAGVSAQKDTIFIFDAKDTRCGFLWRNASGYFRGGKYVVEGSYEHHEAVIHCLDAHDLILEDMVFRGDGEGERMQKGAAIMVRGRERSVEDVIIRNIDIKSRIGTESDVPVPLWIDGKLDGVQRSHWRTNHTPLQSKIPCKRVHVSNVLTDGGYYGCMFSGVHQSTIEFCTFINNTRGISAQDCSNYNTIRWNNIVDNVSAGIHLAYGSSWNDVFWNKVTSSRAHGEGMLQAYVHAKHNRFTGNVTYCEGVGAKYHCYFAVQADGNRASDNTHSGTCQRAYVGVESDWNSTLPETYHRAFNAPDDDNYAGSGTSDVMLMRNVIIGEGIKVLLSAVNNHPLSVVYKDDHKVTTIGNPEML